MESQDTNNIYNLYRENYYRHERNPGDPADMEEFKDPARAAEYYTAGQEDEPSDQDQGGGSMRGYMEDELVGAFEGDGVMDLEEFIGLGEKYLSALYGGRRIDAGDMDLEEFVSRVGEEIGMDLRIRGNRVMLADYRN
jgi:hypothetical protein